MMDDPPKSAKPRDVRETLLRVATELFGDLGLEGASTRLLSRRAGTNLSSIRYHFGGKDGLYKAVLSSIVERFESLTRPLRDEAKRQLDALTGADQEADRRVLMDLLRRLIALMVETIGGKLKIKNAEKVILREQTSPTPHFGILYDGYMRGVIDTFRSLAERYVGGPLPETEWIIRTHSLFAQIIAFLVPREALVRILGVKRLNPDHLAAITRIVTGNVEACLKSWVAKGGALEAGLAGAGALEAAP
jgi:AcrR family transcriptional regulator